MSVALDHDLPVCEVVRDDPARPPLAQRLKSGGMRMAGRLAAVLMRASAQSARDEFGILVYHRVAPPVAGFPAPTFNVSPHVFRAQMLGLQERGFRFLPLWEVLARRTREETLPPRTVVVTFDDGYESVYEHAWPTLRELGIPATVFVNTGYLDQAEPFPVDAWGQAYAGKVPPVIYRPMTTAQCAEMAAAGLMELGAHTHTHADFRGRPETFLRDMQVCLRCLEERFGITGPTFAFPFGKPAAGFTEQPLVDIARRLGVKCALTTEAACVRLSDSPYEWGRFNVYDWDTADTIAAKLLGFYSWAPRLIEPLAVRWPIWRGTAARSMALNRGGR